MVQGIDQSAQSYAQMQISYTLTPDKTNKLYFSSSTKQ